MKTFKGALTAVLAVLACVVLSSCNTMRGLGQDIEKGGEKIQRSVDNSRN